MSNILKGVEFNKKHKDLIFVQLLEDDFVNNSQIFINQNDIHKWIVKEDKNIYKFYRRVIIPKNAIVTNLSNKNYYTSDKLTYSKILSIFYDTNLVKYILDKDPNIFKYIPDNYKNYDICKYVITKYTTLIEYVPDILQTDELCELNKACLNKACLNKTSEIKTYIDDRKKMYENMVMKNGYTLYFVPDNYKTYELCKNAVTQDGCSLKYVPEKFKTYELCKLAVKQNEYSIRYISKMFLSLF